MRKQATAITTGKTNCTCQLQTSRTWMNCALNLLVDIWCGTLSKSGKQVQMSGKRHSSVVLMHLLLLSKLKSTIRFANVSKELLMPTLFRLNSSSSLNSSKLLCQLSWHSETLIWTTVTGLILGNLLAQTWISMKKLSRSNLYLIWTLFSLWSKLLLSQWKPLVRLNFADNLTS